MKKYLLEVKAKNGVIGKILVSTYNKKDIPKVSTKENLNFNNSIQSVEILKVKEI